MPSDFDPAIAGRQVSALAGHHCEELTSQQAIVLALESLGLEAAQVAASLHLRVRTVQNHAAAARQKALPPEVEPTRACAVAWAVLHRQCCLASTWAHLLRRMGPEVARLLTG